MPLSLNWSDLRPHGGSQQRGFEELCCQLAHQERHLTVAGEKRCTKGATFVRKGTPDAGVECYWEFPDGAIVAWQAKFFRRSPESSQWRQVDESVDRALSTHGDLRKYFVCITVDRPDPRGGRQSLMDKWNSGVNKWKEWASKRDMAVDFDFWGEHEIFSRLSLEEHRGRRHFWFNQEYFSKEWFEARFQDVLSQAGPKYSPELNVDLPIRKYFESLGWTTDFQEEIRQHIGEVKSALSRTEASGCRRIDEARFDTLCKQLVVVFEEMERPLRCPRPYLDVTPLVTSLNEAYDAACRLTFSAEEMMRKQCSSEKRLGTLGSSGSYAVYDMRQLSTCLRALTILVGSPCMRLLDRPALLVLGETGSGKTHLFCDVAAGRLREGLPTAIVLGEIFRDAEPWHQLIQLLGLRCTTDEFLGAFDAAGEAAGARALLLIDALNEAVPPRFWEKYLPAMVTSVLRYDWVAIAVSARTTYLKAISGRHDLDKVFVKVTHQGFSGQECSALRSFCKHYKIQMPTVPVLVPEFSNPLFLTLLCKALEREGEGKRIMPRGLNGIISVFEHYLKCIDAELSRRLDYDEAQMLIPAAVSKLAALMADDDTEYLSRERARKCVDELLPRSGYENTLFRHLLSEGVIRKEMAFSGEERVYFVYQRFVDHLIASKLLDEHLGSEVQSKCAQAASPIERLFADGMTCIQRGGIVEALMVQCPERLNKELLDLVPQAKASHSVVHPFLASLKWRHRSAFTDRTTALVNEIIVPNEDSFTSFCDILLMLATVPAHPFNAEMLHRNLLAQPLNARDAWWSTMLFRWYEDSEVDEKDSAAIRLVDWAWSIDEHECIEDESRRLAGIALAWVFTTPHRFLRDKATKAMVNLFSGHLDSLQDVLRMFEEVNDPYVMERLHAVAYGASMRSEPENALWELAEYLYRTVFVDKLYAPHILLRDYARQVIELALVRHPGLQVEPATFRPPYHSEWPDSLPTKEELEERYPDAGSMFHKVFGDSDFLVYVIGSAFGHFASRRLGAAQTPDLDDEVSVFISSLTPRQTSALENMKGREADVLRAQLGNVCREITEGEVPSIVLSEHLGVEGIRLSETQAKAKKASSKNAFLRTLGKQKRAEYEELANRTSSDILDMLPKYKEYFDICAAQAFIFSRAMELGWDPSLFESFDRTVPYYGRDSHKPERMQKKYLWLALHECLARVADNFHMYATLPFEEETVYSGPWEPWTRDIDPSWVPKRPATQYWWSSHSETWWFPYTYTDWGRQATALEWLQDDSDLPCFRDMVAVCDRGIQWLVLEGHSNVHEPIPAGFDSHSFRYRDMWWIVRGYLVHKQDREALLSWAKERDFWGNWMPKSEDQFELFLGEYFWSPAYAVHDYPYYCRAGWSKRAHQKDLPVEVMVTSEVYLHEPGYDCSIDQSVRVYLPCKVIASGMELVQPRVDGRWCDSAGKLVAQDPSVYEKGPGALVIRRDAFKRFLEESDLDIVWTVVGEKWMIGGREHGSDYEGHMRVSGVYWLEDGEVDGSAKATFHAPEDAG